MNNPNPLPPVTNPGPADSDERQPATVAQIKADLAARVESGARALDQARKDRDRLNDKIRVLVAELDEARRILRAFEPRKPRKAKP